MNQNKPVTNEERANGIFQSAFLFVNYMSDKPTEKDREKYLNFLHKKFLEALDNLQKEIEERFSGQVEDLNKISSERLASELSLIQQKKDLQEKLSQREGEIESLKENVNGLGCQLSGYEVKLSSHQALMKKVWEALALSNTILRSIGDNYPDNDEGDFHSRRKESAINVNSRLLNKLNELREG